MASSRIQFSTLILLVILVNISTEALAKKPVSTTPPPDETSTTLNNKQALNLAKAHLTAFQAVDPEFTLKQLKNYILSLNTTSLTEIEESLQSYLLSLQPADSNKAPTISGSPITSITEGESYAFTPSTSDPDGDNLTFSILNKPTWAIFNTNTGNLSGLPAEGTAGIYTNIQISVSDGITDSALPAFDILVSEAVVEPLPGPPTLISAEIVGEDIVLTWVQEKAIPEGGYDTFIDDFDTGSEYRTTSTSVTIVGLELTQNHCFKVESRYTDTGEFYKSNQLCTDAQTAENQAPAISGTPLSNVTVGDSYNFSPLASDPEGDNLSFSITNLPAWASFEPATGILYGTPGEQDIGSYIDIQITVSDGTSSSSLMPFSLTVEPAPVPSSTTLSWVAPTTRADGTPLSLSEINGYRIYMGATEVELAPVMDINDHTVNEYTLTDLATGTYYFCITVYDIDGNESSYSNIILKSML
ncbi:MAG: putative Ig domain-containing protein [Candidatus Thiodiazotropha sp. (ex Myrtea spinifera)]|nr:putative Ig domain-containing protein [Candidatus Thiodiazotropha sp. (ex Myrtea spinifera)]